MRAKTPFTTKEWQILINLSGGTLCTTIYLPKCNVVAIYLGENYQGTPYPTYAWSHAMFSTVAQH